MLQKARRSDNDREASRPRKRDIQPVPGIEELGLPIQIAASNNIGEPSLVRGLVVYGVVDFFIIPY